MLADLWSRMVLKRVRARNEANDLRKAADSSAGTPGANRASLREARFEDFHEISAMNSRLGQGPDSLENWHRLWRENPAIRDLGAPSRIGWVLEDSGRIVGFLGTIPLCYEFAGVPIIAAATCRFAVELEYRAQSYLLVMAFFRQKDVQLFIDSSATPAAGKIMAAAKAQALPQPGYESILFWILNARRYSAYALRKMGCNGILAGLGSIPGKLTLGIANLYRGQLPPESAKGLEIRRGSLTSLGDEFEKFVNSVNHRQNGLLARRSLEILRWHFDPPRNRRPISLFSCFQDGAMCGYLVLRYYEPSPEGLKRSVVADLLARDDDSAIVGALLRAALGNAKSAGADVVEIAGFPSRVRETLLRGKPYSRTLPANPFYFKARDKGLHEALQPEGAWYACAYDGDSTLWP